MRLRAKKGIGESAAKKGVHRQLLEGREKGKAFEKTGDRGAKQSFS